MSERGTDLGIAIALVAVPLLAALAGRGSETLATSLLRPSSASLPIRILAPRPPDPATHRAAEAAPGGRFSWITLPSTAQRSREVAKSLTSGTAAVAPVALRCHGSDAGVCDLAPESVGLCVEAGRRIADLPSCGPEPSSGRTLMSLFGETADVEPTELAKDCQRELCSAFAWELAEGGAQ